MTARNRGDPCGHEGLFDDEAVRILECPSERYCRSGIADTDYRPREEEPFDDEDLLEEDLLEEDLLEDEELLEDEVLHCG